MIYDPLVWFNPGYMIHCGENAKKHSLVGGTKISSEMKKAIEESFAVSVTAYGINQLLGMQLRLQLVDPKEQSPDIRLMYEVAVADGPDNLEYWDIEVVTLEEHSDEQVDEFLKRTKLAATKAYDRETIILCYINKNVQNGKLWKDVSEEIRKLESSNNIFLVGKVHPEKPIYQIARINPTFDSIIQYDVLEEARKTYDKPGGTLFTNVRGREPDREQRRGINPFLED